MAEHEPASSPSGQRNTFAKFLVTGGIAAAANFSSRFGFDLFTSYSVAIVLAYLVGMVTAFVLAKAFVFTDSARSTAHSAAWFTVINALAVLQTWMVTMFLARVLFPKVGFDLEPEAVAHAIGIMVPVFTSYVGHKRLTFKGHA